MIQNLPSFKESNIVLWILLIGILVTFINLIKPNSAVADSQNVLSNPWHLTGNNDDAQAYQQIDKNFLEGKDSLLITYNLHGLCALTGDASALIFDQNGWKYISLAKYGQNCKDGDQTVQIPLSEFKDINSNNQIDTSSLLTGPMHIRFWNSKNFTVDISDIHFAGSSASQAISSDQTTSAVTPTTAGSGITLSPSPTQTIDITTPAVTSSPLPSDQSWAIQSVDAMKYTKDAVCGPKDTTWISNWVDKAVEIGANYVAISTPYDSPSCGSSIDYTRTWATIIHQKGLHVWFREMPLAFEGIYGVSKDTSINFLDQVSQYIKKNSDLYQSGDIFTPIPEPQNGGIANITYCPQNLCQFTSKEAFNQWIRDAMTSSRNAFDSIGMKDIKIGYFGFDGFIAWGDHNPDWHGILEDATVQQMGNITIDHYPEIINETMQQGLDALQAKYPNIPIIIGEWGTIDGSNVVQEVNNSMGAAKRKNVVGFNYWQFGPSGTGEQLINDDFSNALQFNAVESFYKPSN